MGGRNWTCGRVKIARGVQRGMREGGRLLEGGKKTWRHGKKRKQKGNGILTVQRVGTGCVAEGNTKRLWSEKKKKKILFRGKRTGRKKKQSLLGGGEGTSENGEKKQRGIVTGQRTRKENSGKGKSSKKVGSHHKDCWWGEGQISRGKGEKRS